MTYDIYRSLMIERKDKSGGNTFGRINAVRKALTDLGIHLSK